jgi:hypothetical protein
MSFNNFIYFTTENSDQDYYSSTNPRYSILYKLNKTGEIEKESKININGNNILINKLISKSKSCYFIYGKNDKNQHSKNKEFSGKSLIAKLDLNDKIGENAIDFSEEKAEELNIDLDLSDEEQLVKFLKIYDFRCYVGNSYSTVLSFNPDNDDVNSGRVVFTMLQIKRMGFDVVSQQTYRYTIDRTKASDRLYFNTSMKGDIYLEKDGTFVMEDVSRNETYIFQYTKK